MTRFQDKNYYEYLQVTRNADPEVIEGAYRRLAKKYHPDNNPNNPQSVARFQQITEAYETLHDPAARKAYDNWLDTIRSERTSQNARSNASASRSSASGSNASESTASGSFYDAQFDFDMDRVRRTAYANYDQWRGRATGTAEETKSREANGNASRNTNQNAYQDAGKNTDRNEYKNASKNTNKSASQTTHENTAGNTSQSTAENPVKKRRKPILAGAFATIAVVCIVSCFALANGRDGSESLAFAGLRSEAASEMMSETAAETTTATDTTLGTAAETGTAAGTGGSASGVGETAVDIMDDTQSTQQIAYEVTADPSLNVRQAADSSSAKLGSVYYGETCQGTGNISDDGKWIEIYYTSEAGETGWAYYQYLKEVSESSDTQISDEQEAADTAAAAEKSDITDYVAAADESDYTDTIIIVDEQVNADNAESTTETAAAAVKNTDSSVYKEMKTIIDSRVASFGESVLNTRTLSIGGTATPLAASGWGAENILCYSSDESVVTVSSDGTVTAVGAGEAYVFIFSKISINVSKSLGSDVMYEAYKYKVG